MKQRWLVAIIGVPLLLVVLLVCPAWATMLLVAGISAVAAYELLHTVGKKVATNVYAITIFCALVQVWLVYDHRQWLDFAGLQIFGMQNAAPMDIFWVMPWVLVMVLFYFAVRAYGTEKQMPFSDIGAAVVGGAVFPMLYSCITLLRCAGKFGCVYVLMPFFIAFLGDTFSMFGGMLFGKRKMAPNVSPHKTWAGGIAGPIGSALGMLLLGLIAGEVWGYEANYVALIRTGIVANVFGQLGDLSMSMIKREVGIKDYSHIFLTHGGMLDRFDSTMFIAPVVYLMISSGAL